MPLTDPPRVPLAAATRARPPSGRGGGGVTGTRSHPSPASPLSLCPPSDLEARPGGAGTHRHPRAHIDAHRRTHTSSPAYLSGVYLGWGGYVLGIAAPLGSGSERPGSRRTAGGEDGCSFTHPRTFPHPKAHRASALERRNKLRSRPLLPSLPDTPNFNHVQFSPGLMYCGTA